jgi:hypothetical protein
MLNRYLNSLRKGSGQEKEYSDAQQATSDAQRKALLDMRLLLPPLLTKKKYYKGCKFFLEIRLLLTRNNIGLFYIVEVVIPLIWDGYIILVREHGVTA